MSKTPILPKSARLPINRCNLPSIILGSLRFQDQPDNLYIDGVHELHKDFFSLLKDAYNAMTRATLFKDYMTIHFRLHRLQDAGLDTSRKQHRPNADYIRTIRGWFFNPDGREAAVLKAWVESRFGLLARYHNGSLEDTDSEIYQHYLEARSRGLYGTNALESQLDLLYSYCQYELAMQYQDQQVLKLYRGINRLNEHDILQQQPQNNITLLLNNLNSFTSLKERADEFGDYCLEASVPRQKILFYSNLIPGMLKGENEYLVLGGLYKAIYTR